LIGNVHVTSTIGISTTIIFGFNYTYNTNVPIDYTPRVYVNFDSDLLPSDLSRIVDVNLPMQDKIIPLHYFSIVRNLATNSNIVQIDSRVLLGAFYPFQSPISNVNTDFASAQNWLYTNFIGELNNMIFFDNMFLNANNNMYFEDGGFNVSATIAGIVSSAPITINTTDNYYFMNSFLYAELQTV
jgi:hypothetical protein